MEGGHYNLIRQTNDVPRRRQRAKTVPFMPVCLIYIFESAADSRRAPVDPGVQGSDRPVGTRIQQQNQAEHSGAPCNPRASSWPDRGSFKRRVSKVCFNLFVKHYVSAVKATLTASHFPSFTARCHHHLFTGRKRRRRRT